MISPIVNNRQASIHPSRLTSSGGAWKPFEEGNVVDAKVVKKRDRDENGNDEEEDDEAHASKTASCSEESLILIQLEHT